MTADLVVADVERLRGRLDALDARLLAVLDARLQCCLEIAQAKSRHGLPMMAPHRIGLVHARARRYAEDHGIDPRFLRDIYELVIAEACRLENIAMAPTEDLA